MLLPLKDDNPTYSVPIITIVLIAANVLVYLYQMSLGYGEQGEQFVFQLGAIPYEIAHFRDISVPNIIPPPFTLFSSMFLHGGLAHVGGNMLYLWIFGNNIEDALGRGRFLFFYLLCGIIAGLAQTISDPNSDIPMIGASGAVAGVLGAYIMLFPDTRILTLMFLFIFVRLIYVPAVIVLGFWFIIQILNAGVYEGVAWYAHIGGFAAGAFFIRLFFRRKRASFRVWY